MRYGYESQWFGKEVISQKVSAVAHRLLLALCRERKVWDFCARRGTAVKLRPILFIAHCFGGLVVLKALLDAQHDDKDYLGIFTSTTGLVFLGTPFRGAPGMSSVEMLAAARQEYQEDEIQPDILKILQPGNEFLQDIVDRFGKMRKQANKAQIACFYELKPSNVGKMVGRQDRTVFLEEAISNRRG